MQKKFHYNNADIFYRTEGEGMPVVLLHGIPLDGNVWNGQIDFLKDHCKLIVPDIPGSGKSTFEKHEAAGNNNRILCILYLCFIAA